LTTDSPEQTLGDIILQTTKEHKPETVNQLTRIVRDKLPNSSQQQILDAITQLQNEGRLKLSPRPPATSKLSAYVQTSRATWFWTTLACTLASVAAVFLIPPDAGLVVIVRNVLGILFILWFPGYTFIKALFPTTLPMNPTDKDLDTIERVALSIGLSLALVPITGLLLNYTQWGITLTPITLSLTALTLIFATAALLRESQNRNKQAQT
jgi:hypothetical protein